MKKYSRILILTGAGISAESGLATFRSSNGLWNNHKVEDVASVEGFQRNPDYVHDFYNNLKTEIQQAKPNAAHLAITRLQQEYPAHVDVVTQNVDTLHEKAKNQNIYHIHGQINQAVCLNCGHILETWGDVDTQTICPQCNVMGMMKPNIVFFGENLLCMDSVEEGVIPKEKAEDLLIIASVFIEWDAADKKKVHDWNYEATKLAIKRAITGEPKVDEVLAKKNSAVHPFN